MGNNDQQQISVKDQYPNATKVEDGVAYDISGKKLGPVKGMEADQDPFAGSIDAPSPNQATQDPFAGSVDAPVPGKGKVAQDPFAGAIDAPAPENYTLGDMVPVPTPKASIRDRFPTATAVKDGIVYDKSGAEISTVPLGTRNDKDIIRRFPEAATVENGFAYDIDGKILGPAVKGIYKQDDKGNWFMASRGEQARHAVAGATAGKASEEEKAADEASKQGGLDKLQAGWDKARTAFGEGLEQAAKGVAPGVSQLGHAIAHPEKLQKFQEAAQEAGAGAAEQAVFGRQRVDETGKPIPGSTEEQVGRGVVRAVGGMAAGMAADPTQVGLLAVMPVADAIPALKLIVSGAFSIQMGRAAKEGAIDLIDNWENYTPQERAEKITTTGLDSAFAVLATKHAGGKTLDSIMDRTADALRSNQTRLRTGEQKLMSASTIHDARLSELQYQTDQVHSLKEKADEAAAKLSERKTAGDASPEEIQQLQQALDQARSNLSEGISHATKAAKAATDSLEAKQTAAAEVERLQAKVQGGARKALGKQNKAYTKQHAGAYEDWRNATPPVGKRGNAAHYQQEDMQRARPYVEQFMKDEKVDKANKTGNQGLYNALDHAQQSIEQQIAPFVEKYQYDANPVDVIQYVRDKMAELSTKDDFVNEGMEELSKQPIKGTLTIGESEKIRESLNNENRGSLAKNKWATHDALANDPAYAARYFAAEAIRKGEYDLFNERKVYNIDQLRRDETSVIRMRNAAEASLEKGGHTVRGSGKSGIWRQTLAGTSEVLAGTAMGTVGGTIGSLLGPIGATSGSVAGSIFGHKLGEKLGRKFLVGDLTRDALADRSLGVDTQATQRLIHGDGTQPEQILSETDMRHIRRENSPLHGQLAAYLGDVDGEKTYGELEQEFKNEYARQLAYGTVGDDEKKLFAEITKQDKADRLQAAQEAQKAAEEGKDVEPPQPTLPKNGEPVMRIPGLEQRTSQEAIAGHLAQIFIGDQHGFEFPDGVRTHVHAETGKAGTKISAPVDLSNYLDEDGQVDLNKLSQNLPKLIETLLAPGVANDLWHNVPFTHEESAPVKALTELMKRSGMSEAAIEKQLHESARAVADRLDQPGVREVIEGHSRVREKGLDDRHHVSAERSEQVLADLKGLSNESTSGESTGVVPKGERPTGRGGPGAGGGVAAAVPEGGVSKGVPEKGIGATKGKEATEATSTGADNPAAANVKLSKSGQTGTGGTTIPKGMVESALPEDHPIRVELESGEVRNVTIPAHSSFEAINQAMKIPGAVSAELVSKAPERVASTKYEVPKGKVTAAGHNVNVEVGPSGEVKFVKKKQGVAETVKTIVHELGHAIAAHLSGLGKTVETIDTPNHPQVTEGALAVTNLNWDSLMDKKTGKFTHKSVQGKVIPMMRAVMGGIAADMVFHGMSFADAVGGGGASDYQVAVGLLQRWEKEAAAAAGRAPDLSRVSRIISQALMENIRDFNHPVTRKMIEENAPHREQNLSRQYHYSNERIQNMFAEHDRRMAEHNAAGQPKEAENDLGALQATLPGFEGVEAGGEGGPTPGVREGIGTQPAAKVAGPASQLEVHEKEGGSTFTPQGKNLMGKDLHAVGAYPDRTLQVDKLTPETLEKFKADNADVLSKGDHAVGTWKDPDTGKSVLDVVKTIKDRDEAIAAGKAANQKSIYHLGGDGEIQTGGTGDYKNTTLASADDYADALRRNPTTTSLIRNHGEPMTPEQIAEQMKGRQLIQWVKDGKPQDAFVGVSPDGNISRVVNNAKDAVQSLDLVRAAIDRGGNKIDAWDIDGKLPRIYEGLGFKIDRTVPYDVDSYGEPSEELKDHWRRFGWKDGDKYPDVTYMSLGEAVPKSAPETQLAKTAKTAPMSKEELKDVYEAFRKGDISRANLDGIVNGDTQDITIWNAVKQYGLTDEPKKAGYILPNGKGLDFSDGRGAKTLDHGDIAGVLPRKGPDAVPYNADPRFHFVDKTKSARLLVSRDVINVQLPSSGATRAQIDFINKAVQENPGKTLNVDIQGPDENTRMGYAYHTPESIEDVERVISDAKRDYNKRNPGGAEASDEDITKFAKMNTVKGSTVPLMEKPRDVKGTGKGGTILATDIAAELNKFTKSQHPALIMGKAKEATMVKRAKTILEHEAKYQLGQSNSGRDWYTADMKEHDNIISSAYPELKDPITLGVFKIPEAILSAGFDPPDNIAKTFASWDNFQDKGEFSPVDPKSGESWGRYAKEAYGNAMMMTNQLLAEKGPEGAVQWLKSEHPIEELRQYNPGVKGPAGSSQYGALILGSKRGPFYLNLNGIESPFTVDQWVNRTWNRWMGTIDTEVKDGKLAINDKVRNEKERSLMKQSYAETAGKLDLTTSSLQAVQWYYEQGLYRAHGLPIKSWSYADAAGKVLSERGERPGKMNALDFIKALERKP